MRRREMKLVKAGYYVEHYFDKKLQKMLRCTAGGWEIRRWGKAWKLNRFKGKKVGECWGKFPKKSDAMAKYKTVSAPDFISCSMGGCQNRAKYMTGNSLIGIYYCEEKHKKDYLKMKEKP